jgi:hypothetical protein
MLPATVHEAMMKLPRGWVLFVHEFSCKAVGVAFCCTTNALSLLVFLGDMSAIVTLVSKSGWAPQLEGEAGPKA